jgi:hypothetical protein
MIVEKIGFEVLKKSLPYIQEKLGLLKEEFEHYSENKLIPYILSNYETLNQSTSQLFRNKGYKIDQLYVPLTLSDSDGNFFLIDRFPMNLFKSHNRIIINDSAGMGKSTVLKMLFRYSVDEGKLIPFYVDLKSLVKDGKVINVQEYILETFPTLINQPSRKFLLELLQETPFLFLFDGADEVPDVYKSEVFNAVLSFCSSARKCNFVVATRDEDKILSSFNSFKSFSINPLELQEAYELLRKYQFKDVKASNLIAELEKEENKPVLEFLKNPLLTTLLYTAYAYKRKIPLKKNLFFGQIFEALYENHDATKIGYLTREKKSRLDIDSFEKILAHLAYVSRVREKLEYTKTELLELVSEISQSHPTVNFDIRGFVDDLISSVPVLRRDGLVLSWQHKSIQEYLFVRFLFLMFKDDKREEVINKIISAESIQRYKLVLDIIYDENDELFHKVVTRKILDYALRNRAERCKGVDNLNDSINVFYRYVSAPLKKLIHKSVLDDFNMTIMDDSGRKFEIIREELSKKFELKSFGCSSSRISWGGQNTSFATFYESPLTTCLSVLFDKNTSFVDRVEIEEGYDDEVTALIENCSKLGSIEELNQIGVQSEIFIFDILQCKGFLDELDEKLQKREHSLELLNY